MKNKIKNVMLLFCLISIPSSIFGQAETIFNNIHFNESLEIVNKKIKEISETTNVINVESPSFPLAANKEAHLVCKNIKTKNGTIVEMVLTFADDKLVYIEAHGNVIKSIVDIREDKVMDYLIYKVYPSDLLVANVEKDIVWMLTKDGGKLNLFTWNNPYLHSSSISIPVYKPSSTKIPEFLKMNGELDKLRPILNEKSALVFEEELDGSDPTAQLQLNCLGIVYAGFPRSVEARFGNGKLNTVWILTGKPEEKRIRERLIKSFGKSIYVNDKWEVFNNWQVYLRKDKTEILLTNKALGLERKKEILKL